MYSEICLCVHASYMSKCTNSLPLLSLEQTCSSLILEVWACNAQKSLYIACIIVLYCELTITFALDELNRSFFAPKCLPPFINTNQPFGPHIFLLHISHFSC